MHAVHDAILFDLDGVLVDSRTPIARSINATLVEHGLPARPEPELYPLIGPPMHESFRLLAGLDDVDHLVETYRGRYRTRMMAETTVQPGIPELLDTIDLLDLGKLKRGRHKISVGHVRGGCCPAKVVATVRGGNVVDVDVKACKDRKELTTVAQAIPMRMVSGLSIRT